MNAKLLHATAVAIDGCGVLLLGPSGSGKSDFALRLIDRGAKLVSDDAVPVATKDGLPILTIADNIEGKLEVRGVGICNVAHTSTAPLRLAVQLTDIVERFPEGNLRMTINDFSVPLLYIVPFEASAALKLEYALRSVVDADIWPVALEGACVPESRTT
jgi:serine kinase of HPr protein (carbohydrate metabolism regulator)